MKRVPTPLYEMKELNEKVMDDKERIIFLEEEVDQYQKKIANFLEYMQEWYNDHPKEDYAWVLDHLIDDYNKHFGIS